MYDKICLMCPTYGRHNTLLPQFINSAIATASNVARVCFCFCVNTADQKTREYLKSVNFRGHGWEIIDESLPKPHLAKYFNAMYNYTMTKPERGTVVSMTGDDMSFETTGWDRILLDLINVYRGTGAFWCNDAFIAREKCAVNLFVTRDFVEATEHPFMCEDFAADLIDTVWTLVGKYTRTQHFLPDVIIRHNHNLKKPQAQWDATFKRLGVGRAEAHVLGKPRAKDVARKIADILISKGLTGDSI